MLNEKEKFFSIIFWKIFQSFFITWNIIALLLLVCTDLAHTLCPEIFRIRFHWWLSVIAVGERGVTKLSFRNTHLEAGWCVFSEGGRGENMVVCRIKASRIIDRNSRRNTIQFNANDMMQAKMRKAVSFLYGKIS